MCCIVKCCNCHILLAVDMAGEACQGLVCVCVCVCVCEVGKMAKDIGMTRVLWYHFYLVWLLFGDSIPICSLIFYNVFVTCFCCFFCGEEKGMNGV